MYSDCLQKGIYKFFIQKYFKISALYLIEMNYQESIIIRFYIHTRNSLMSCDDPRIPKLNLKPWKEGFEDINNKNLDIDNSEIVFNYPKKKCSIQSDCDLGNQDPRFRCETIGFENYCVPDKCFRNSDCIDIGRHLSNGVISSKGCKFRSCKYNIAAPVTPGWRSK